MYTLFLYKYNFIRTRDYFCSKFKNNSSLRRTKSQIFN